MKIAIFSDCYLDLTGGITSSINAQKTALEERGHTVLIFSTGYPRTTQDLEALAARHIYQVPSCKYLLRGITPVSRRPHLIKKWLLNHHPELKDFDIFYIHYEAGCSIAGLELARELHIPAVQVMHGREDMGETNIIPFGLRTLVAAALNWCHSWYIPHSIKIPRDHYLANTLAKTKMWELMVNHANFADLVLTPSQHFKNQLMHYGVTQTVKVFPNGFPDHNFPPKPSAKTFDPTYPLRIIWHSRVSGEKRIMPFLQALTLIQPNYQLDVFGDGNDLPRAKRFAKRHHLNVTFHGAVPFAKLATAMQQAHLDILASYNFDTFGMTLIEARAYGTPALICDPNLKEIIPTGGYLLTTDPSSTAIANSLNQIFQNPDLIHQMSTVMLKHRSEILISRRIKLLEKIFNML